MRRNFCFSCVAFLGAALLLHTCWASGAGTSLNDDDAKIKSVTDEQFAVENSWETKGLGFKWYEQLMMPCKQSQSKCALGYLFLVGVYCCIIVASSKIVMDGAQKLVVVSGSFIVGGVLLSLLQVLPTTVLIMVAGLMKSDGPAHNQMPIALGLLSGSTVMALTILWATCLLVGKYDITANLNYKNSQQTSGSCTEFGVTTDAKVRKTALIMVFVVIPSVINQILQICIPDSAKRTAELVASSTALVSFLIYCAYQMVHPWIPRTKIHCMKHRSTMASVPKIKQSRGWGKLLTDDGEPDFEKIEQTFKTLDGNKDGYLTRDELGGFIIGIQAIDQNIETISLGNWDASGKREFSLQDFKVGMSTWLRMAVNSVNYSNPTRYLSLFLMNSKELHESIDNMDEGLIFKVDKPFRIYIRAIILMVGGGCLLATFAFPLVGTVGRLSDVTGFSSFLISFIVLNVAANLNLWISVLMLHRGENAHSATLTYSEIYSANTITVTLCLGVFFATGYFSGLTCGFSEEVLVMLHLVLIVGSLSSFRSTFPAWISVFAILLYPLTLLLSTSPDTDH